MVYWLINKILIAYVYSTSAYLLAKLFIAVTRERSDRFLNNSNLLVLPVLIVNAILVAMNAAECKIEQFGKLEKMKAQGYHAFVVQDCFTYFIWTLILGFGFQLFFLFERYRKRTSMTIISVVLLIILWNIEKVIAYTSSITNLYADSLPSEWNLNDDSYDLAWTVAISIGMFLFSWVTPDLIRTNRTK